MRRAPNPALWLVLLALSACSSKVEPGPPAPPASGPAKAAVDARGIAVRAISSLDRVPVPGTAEVPAPKPPRRR